MSKKPAASIGQAIASIDQPITSGPIRIFKIGTCPSLSQLSTLTYHVGCDGLGEILFRVFGNSSSGYFSKEWVSLSTVLELFNKHPAEKPLTSFAIRSVYAGKSANSPGFLFAALKQEGFVQALADATIRGYERGNSGAFYAEAKLLMESGVSLEIAQAPPTKKSAPVGKPKKAARHS